MNRQFIRLTNAAIGSKLRGLDDDEPWLTVTPLMRPTACERSGNQ